MKMNPAFKKNPYAAAKNAAMRTIEKNAIVSQKTENAPSKMKSGTYPLYKNKKATPKDVKRKAMTSGRTKKYSSQRKKMKQSYA